jgi:hypothetical protein
LKLPVAGYWSGVWGRRSLSGADPASVAERDVSRLLAASAGLRRIVELADREAPDDGDSTSGAEDRDDESVAGRSTARTRVS